MNLSKEYMGGCVILETFIQIWNYDKKLPKCKKEKFSGSYWAMHNALSPKLSDWSAPRRKYRM